MLTAGAIAAAEPEVEAPETPVLEPGSTRAEAPEGMPPPAIPAASVVSEVAPTTVEDEALEATGLMEPVTPEAEPELDARELKALSRQERKEAKAALRREQQEARNAARQAKAMAKAAAKAGLAASTTTAATAAAASTGDADADVAEPATELVEATSPEEPDVDQGEVEAPESSEAAATDPRSRAAQRVQRRLGKDAEKLSAAEARARAREEARRRRAQAKEQSAGVIAEEAVVRPPAEPTEGNLAEDVSVVESPTELIEVQPVMDEPEVVEPVAEQPVAEEPDLIEEPEPDLPMPVVEQRIDEPAPDDVHEAEPEVVEQPEPELVEEPEPVADLKPHIEIREIHKPAPAEGEAGPKSQSSLAPIAGIVGLIALGISVLLAVGALLVALGFDSGGLYEALRAVANLLVGPLEGAFDFSGANAERKEHFLAWGAGSIGYLLISFVGQAVQRANDED